FDCSNLGSNNVNLTVTDASGNFRTVSANVTIADTTKPTLAVNSTVNLFLNASGNATLTTAMVNNGSTDNCSISTLSLSKTAFTGADLGNNIVTLTATDGSSNSRNTSVTVVVIDSVRPIAIAQNVTAYLNGTGTATVTAAQVNNGSTDNVGTPSLSLSATSFTCSNLGSNNVTLTVTDGSGNFRTANAIVTVLDTIRPLVSAQNITTYINSSGTVSITAAQVTASSSDNCFVASAVLSKSTFDCSNLGSNNVNLTVTDGSGNFRTVSATVTVLDTIRPIALISNNFNLYLNASGTATLTTAMINNGSSDNCSIANLSLSKTNFTGADLGNNSVVFTVTDNSNNNRSVNVNVIVIDSMKPIAIAQNRTIYLNASGNASITANEVNNGSSDNVGITGLALSQVNFTCNNVGANPVTLTVSDVSGNFRTANAIITVLDSIKPTANANNLTVYINSLGFATITEAMANNNSSDNCGTPTIGLSKSSFDCSNLGINNLVLTATDRNANTNTANFTVNVLDTLRPTTVVNNNLNIYLDASGNVNLTAAQVDAGSTDNCSIASLSISKTSFAGVNLGLNTITFTATDGSGNFRTVNVNIFVRDTMVPLIRAKDVTVYLGSTGGASINPALIDDNSTDNVGITNRSLSKTFFNCNELGSNQIIYSIRDASGNESSTIFTVNVLDTTRPNLVSSPKDVVVGFCNDRINYNLPIGTDNCANVTVTQTTGLPSGSTFPTGLTINTFELTDPSGNKITTSFRVVVIPETVVDTFPDLEFCADRAAFDLSLGDARFTFTGTGIAKDRVTFDPTISGAGNFVITAQFRDSMGCTSTGTFTVTVNRVPDKPTIERLSSTRLSANANFEFYQWYRNNEPIAGATNKTLDVTQSGIYGLVVRNSSACVNGSDPFPLGVALGNSGIVKDENLFNVYPNPTSAMFYIELKGISSKGTQVVIMDMLGKEISNFQATSDVMEIDALNFAPGTYYVRVQQADKLLVKPIVIVK
ncbi:MAG: HYR domain-containing protein, partial [Bacteroidota bacterium]|nr:HYR domain-containing protein [Bacteroidota bacterium]